MLGEVLAIGEADSSEDPIVAHPILLPRTAVTQIAEGSRYTVPEGKAVVISFVPGISAVAHESADLRCDTLRLTKDGDETSDDAMKTREVAVRLAHGAATFSLPWKNISGRSSIEVTVPRARIGAGCGSLFHVEAKGETVRITSVRLKARVTTEAGEAEIGAGEFCELPASDAAALVKAAETDVAAQDAVRSALADEEKISGVMAAKRNAIPAWRHP